MTPVRLTIRAKLLGLAGITGAAFAFILVASSVLTSRVEGQLESIQGRYLPRLELQPQLESQLEHLTRALQDAVVARDLDGLDDARVLEEKLLQRLSASSGVLEADSLSSLRQAIETYWTQARDVSRRLIGGETGEQLPDAIAAMQVSQRRVVERIQDATSMDADDLAAAFRRAADDERIAGRYRSAVSVACLVLVVALAVAISRGMVRSMSAVTRGFERFGRSDFAQPIHVTSGDELGELADHANRMAEKLEQLVAERRKAEADLRMANKELEAFSYSVAHDLRAPLRSINGFSTALREDYGPKLDAGAGEYLGRIMSATERMGELIDALLSLARITRAELHRAPVDFTRVATGVAAQLKTANPDHDVAFECGEGVVAEGDAVLLRALLENLLGNAWKFTKGTSAAQISFGVDTAREPAVYVVKDNGAGFDMTYASRLFTPFQRLHSQKEFAGTGIGLATVHKIVVRHGGRIWAEGTPGKGATFRFTLEGGEQGAES